MFRTILKVVFLYALPCFAALGTPVPRERAPVRPDLSVHFSPNGGCTQAVVAEIDAAKTEVLVQAYSFTSKPIYDALVAAHKRGVVVKAVFDKSDLTGKGELAVALAQAGVPCWSDRQHHIAHNKVMIIDAGLVITGSFNFSTAAETQNAENMIVIRSPTIAKLYKDNWIVHQKHSAPIFRL